ncbi:MAG: lasso peptide biosynthesis B2 protein [Lysobacteraceae bacterium]
MGRRLDRWRALSWHQRGILIRCAVGVSIIHAALAMLGYTRLRRLIERCSRHPQPRPATEADVLQARELARLAAMAGRQAVGEAACLRRSLHIYGVLRRRGLRPVLQIGVGPQTGTFQAHAWVELEGTPLLDSDVGFRPFERRDPSSS